MGFGDIRGMDWRFAGVRLDVAGLPKRWLEGPSCGIAIQSSLLTTPSCLLNRAMATMAPMQSARKKVFLQKTFLAPISHNIAMYHGAQNDYTRFYYLGISFPVAQDICYIGLAGRNSFVWFGRLQMVVSVNANYTRIFWELIFQLHAHLLRTKICFRIICVITCQNESKDNNYNSNRHLLKHLYSACVVALLSPTLVEKAL